MLTEEQLHEVLATAIGGFACAMARMLLDVSRSLRESDQIAAAEAVMDIAEQWAEYIPLREEE